MIEKENCCGCANCSLVCPKKAIQMNCGELDFLYPVIDMNKCVDCGLCEKVCPQLQQSKLEDFKKAYVFKMSKKKQRLRCQSGGAFTALAMQIINNSGVVYGVSLDKELKPVYERVISKERLWALSGSKYVQADMLDSVKRVKEDLENSKTVLYCGTPCNISALKNYLSNFKTNCENLILVEFLCHGVLSQELYKEYIKHCKIKYRNVKGFNFRDKKVLGWGTYYSTLNIGKGFKVASTTYLDIFRSDCYLRDSCYDCKYTSMERGADITISDYWGIGNYRPECSDRTGVSMILCNSQKGELLVQRIGGFKREMPLDTIMQNPLENPTKKPDEFYKARESLKLSGYSQLFEKYKAKEIIMWNGIPITSDVNFLLKYYSIRVKMSYIYLKLKEICGGGK